MHKSHKALEAGKRCQPANHRGNCPVYLRFGGCSAVEPQHSVGGAPLRSSPLPGRLTSTCKKNLVARDQSYMPRHSISARTFGRLPSMSPTGRKSYSKTLLQRRKFSSWYFSTESWLPRGWAKRGSFSRAEKMVF